MNRTTKLLGASIALAVAVLFSTSAGAAPTTVIDTLTGWNGTDAIQSFGEPDTATYGQTVTVGTDNLLNGFTFSLRQLTSEVVRFRAYVMDWNDTTSRAIGPVLFQSGNLQTSGLPGFETFNINTGNLPLTAGNDYVLFFNVSNNFSGLSDESEWASRADANVYPGGLFVFLNNGANFNAVTTDQWTRDWQGPGYDLAFRAEFSRIPEPTCALLAALGIVGTSTLVRRQRREV